MEIWKQVYEAQLNTAKYVDNSFESVSIQSIKERVNIILRHNKNPKLYEIFYNRPEVFSNNTQLNIAFKNNERIHIPFTSDYNSTQPFYDQYFFEILKEYTKTTFRREWNDLVIQLKKAVNAVTPETDLSEIERIVHELKSQLK